MSFIKKPLLAADVDDVSKLDFRYGFLATPKIDGIRCLVLSDCEHGRVVSRTFKPIPNKYIVTQLTFNLSPAVDFDGELVRPGGTFQDSTSLVMTQSPSPVVFRYYVFDVLGSQVGLCYKRRMAELKTIQFPSFVTVLLPEEICSIEHFYKYEADCLKLGFEGVMLRSATGLYKFGRSTLDEGILLKVKRWRTSEAIIESVASWQQNTNVSERDHLGYLKKSHRKAGKKKESKLGSFLVRDVDTGKLFSVGSGLNNAQRAELWRRRAELTGRRIVYKFLPYNTKDAPRCPIFVGFREEGF